MSEQPVHSDLRQAGGSWLSFPLDHQRITVAIFLLAAIVLSWAYLLSGSGTGMSVLQMSSWDMALGNVTDTMAMTTEWTPSYVLTMLVMWWVMMAAMMLPSALPAILLYTRMDNRMAARAGREGAVWNSLLFSAGYLLSWGLFSVTAVTAQWLFVSVELLSPMLLNGTAPLFAAGILIAAGLYQLSPVKNACLRYCRGPLVFFTAFWQDGASGALRMGLTHGFLCVGCCAGIMALLFFGGIMNLYWIIAIAVLVGVEKLVPATQWVPPLTGVLLIAWSGLFIYRWFT